MSRVESLAFDPSDPIGVLAKHVFAIGTPAEKEKARKINSEWLAQTGYPISSEALRREMMVLLASASWRHEFTPEEKAQRASAVGKDLALD